MEKITRAKQHDTTFDHENAVNTVQNVVRQLFKNLNTVCTLFFFFKIMKGRTLSAYHCVIRYLLAKRSQIYPCEVSNRQILTIIIVVRPRATRTKMSVPLNGYQMTFFFFFS